MSGAIFNRVLRRAPYIRPQADFPGSSNTYGRLNAALCTQVQNHRGYFFTESRAWRFYVSFSGYVSELTYPGGFLFAPPPYRSQLPRRVSPPQFQVAQVPGLRKLVPSQPVNFLLEEHLSDPVERRCGHVAQLSGAFGLYAPWPNILTFGDLDDRYAFRSVPYTRLLLRRKPCA